MYRLSWLVLIFCACDPGPPPESLLSSYRVLGVVADQPEISPDGRVTLTAIDYLPEGEPTYTWTLCLYSLGSRARFACADPALEQTLPETGPTATLDFGPAGLDFRRRFEEASPLTGLDGETLTLEEGVDVVAGLTAQVGERKVLIYKRIRIREGGEPNQNPQITGFEVPEPLTPGALVDLAITVSPAETYTEASTGRTFTERLQVNFYTDAGRLADRGPFDETTLDTEWRLPSEPGPATLFAAVRDGRGGLSIVRKDVVVGP